MDSSRIASFSQGFALLLLAASAGCSSTSGGGGASSGSSGSGSSGSGSSGSASSGSSSSGGGTVLGTGMMCPAATTRSVGVQINVDVTWPATSSINGGSGAYVLWLLSEQTIDASNKIMSVTHTCQLTTPPISLTATGDLASGLPMGAHGKVGTASPVTEWEKVTRTIMTTGMLGGWTVGSSIAVDASVSLFGLADSSKYADPTVKWPPFSSTGVPFGDNPMYTMDEGDGNPGVAVIPLSTDGYAKIRTGLGGMQPAVDKLFIASRTDLSMYGKSTSCTDAQGTADVKLIDNHVIGCELENMGGPCPPAGSGYIDSNRTVYKPGKASFTQKVLADGAKCPDVISALPPPT